MNAANNLNEAGPVAHALNENCSPAGTLFPYLWELSTGPGWATPGPPDAWETWDYEGVLFHANNW